MPGPIHSSLVDVLVGHLALVVELLREAGVVLPEFDELEHATESLAPSQLGPFLPDVVVRLMRRQADGARACVLVVIVEVQLRPEAAKVGSLALYGPLAVGLFRAPALLVVVTPSDSVARWARDLPAVGSVVPRPLVLGPEELLGWRHDGALTVERAVLVALAHATRSGPAADLALEAAVTHLVGLDDAQRVLHFLDMLSEQFGRKVHHLWETMMPASTREYRSEWFRSLINEGLEQGLEQGLEKGLQRGRQEGRQEGRETGLGQGRAESILTILETRGLPVADALAARIRATTDLAVLDRWLRRAVTAPKAEDVVAD